MPGYEELLAKINKLKRDGGVGYRETKTIVPDKNGEYIDIFGDGIGYQHVSDEAMDLHGLSTIRFKVGTQEQVYTQAEFTVIDDGEGSQYCCIQEEGGELVPFLLSIMVPDLPVPMGVYAAPGVVSATFETIHPIDPKYLPGVCLPVVEVTGEETTLSEETSALLTAYAEKCVPIVVKMGINVFSAVLFSYINEGDGIYMSSVGVVYAKDGTTGLWSRADV